MALSFSILQRKRLGVTDFGGLADVEAKFGAVITEWNEIAHPFQWSPRSFDKVLASIGEEIAAAA